ncbi:hexosaminidase [Actinokineospora auranticolor]|uniref:beta-N-acetylhexosaminidase n=2 Tax=Actinokineospora auranticolor TaxID=155976 RepID=A0A2S6H093_9PSEU|nr:hexosaminidase [Actinokineospora auranticolor]
MTRVIPAPVSVEPDRGADFELTAEAVIRVGGGAEEVGEYLAGVLRPSTGYALPVVRGGGAAGISLELGDVGAELGAEGYRLDVGTAGVDLRANTAAGLFAGVQTLRQLLPAEVESATAQPGPWPVEGGRVVDYPRFAYRGAMLDVTRHFFTPEQVKRYIDQIALYKVNHLHLHLTDDQGWRIEIERWPRLTTHGGTEVGDGPGGSYTKAQYRDLVSYAASRHITVVPEIDLPGHTNAALAAYPELNPDGVAREPYTGIEVGFSCLDIDSDVTYRFVEDVLTEVAELTPGPYLHLGGDEALQTPDADFIRFFDRVLPIAQATGKQVVAWHEFLKVESATSVVGQYWGNPAAPDNTADALVRSALDRVDKIIMSPANKSYLDMKYDEDSPLGLKWAGYVEVDAAYDWDPADFVDGLPEAKVLGVEAPLWSETLENSDHIEYMAFPRLPAIAEIGWSPRSTHDWESFRARLAEQAPRWAHRGIGFYRSPKVDWP